MAEQVTEDMAETLLPEDGKPYWRSNLAVVWISQFFSMIGFALSMPFAPFYIRNLLIKASVPSELIEDKVKLYAALSVACASGTMALIAPLWGVVADKYGRKPMVIRACLGASVMIALMGFAPNVEFFLFCRCIQGLFSGTMTAAMTMVAGCTPKSRQGFALGLLSAGVYSGDVTGQFIGGVLAENFGYRLTFTLGGSLLAFAGFLVLFFGREEHRRRLKTVSVDAGRRLFGWMVYVRPCLPLYAALLLIGMSRVYDNSQFPLYIEFLNGGPDVAGKEVWTGRVAGIASLGAMTAGIVIGRLLDRFRPHVVACIAAGGACLVMGLIGILPPQLMSLPRWSGDWSVFGHVLRENAAPAVLMMFPLRFLMVSCSAGLEPVVNVWLSKNTQQEHRGVVFGCSVSFRAVGFVLGPLLSGMVSMKWGIRTVFFVGPFLFFSLIPLFLYVSRRFSVRRVPGGCG